MISYLKKELGKMLSTLPDYSLLELSTTKQALLPE